MTDKPIIKLEILGSSAVRSSIIFTHLVLVIGAILTAVTQLGYDRHELELPFRECPDQILIQGKNACYVDCGSYLTWIGLSDDVSPNAGEFKLAVDLPEKTTFKYNASIFAGDHDSFAPTESSLCSPMESIDGWEKVFYQEKQKGGCSEENCVDVQIVDTSSTVWGKEAGGYNRYLVAVDFMDTSLKNLEFTLSYRISQFRTFVVGLRTLFALGTLLALLYWLCAVRAFPRRFGSRTKFFCCCCGGPPLLRLVFWFLLFMAIWQNPIFMIAQLGDYRGVNLNVVAEAFNSLGWSFILATWSLMAYEIGRFDEKSRDKDSWKVYTISIIFGIFLSITSILMNIASKPELFHGPDGIQIFGISEVDHDLRKAGVGLGAVYTVLLILWLLWFGAMVLVSWVTLSDSVYMWSRARQLIVRYFMWQTISVVLFVVIVDLIPVIQYFKQAYENFENGEDIDTDTAKLVGIVQKISQGYQSVGSYFLVAVHSFFVFYALLPAKAVGWIEQLVWKLLGIITLSGSDDGKRPFSLTEASWLFDFICAANFDPENNSRINADDRTESSPHDAREATKGSQGPLEMAPHGFSIDGFIYSKKSGTIVIIFRKEFRVVLVFRAAQRDNVAPSLLTEDDVEMQSLDFSKRESGACSCCPGVRELTPRVREDVWERYVSVREALRRSLALVFYKAGEDVKLYSTGYDIGGGVAALAAYDCKHLVRNSRRDSSHSFVSTFCKKLYSFVTCGWCYSGEMTEPLLEEDEENSPQARSSINRSSQNFLYTLVDEEDEKELKTKFRRTCGAEAINRPDVTVGTSFDADSSKPTNDRDDIVRAYLFGSERLGNGRFTAKYNKAIPWTFFVSTEGDFRTRRPESRFPLSHPGNFVLIDSTVSNASRLGIFFCCQRDMNTLLPIYSVVDKSRIHFYPALFRRSYYRMNSYIESLSLLHMKNSIHSLHSHRYRDELRTVISGQQQVGGLQTMADLLLEMPNAMMRKFQTRWYDKFQAQR